MTDEWAVLRDRMVETQIRSRGVADTRVLDALRAVPRHLFVPEADRRRAYEDTPLAIGFGQTISQPYIVAFMTEAVEPKEIDRVLEIGTGCGYQTAVLASLVREVFSIEVVAPLQERARGTLETLGFRNVQLRAGDGYRGWPEAAPFDKILLTAAPAEVPPALVEQLAVGGVMVAPVGLVDQVLTVYQKTGHGLTARGSMAVRFVPMVETSEDR